NRIGKTRAVHVKKHVATTRKFTDRRNLFARVSRAKFRCLSDTDRARLVRMQFVLTCYDRFGLADVELAVRATNQKQLRSFSEKFRRAALVGLNMRVCMTDNALE